MNNLFSEYEPIVAIRESSIHDLFFRHNSILVIINKLTVISTPFRGVIGVRSGGSGGHWPPLLVKMH